ncbi:MAG: hypothetical protein KDK71_03745 [Chlamydiia bacterium]|nr:hypothetical protein [Chlamydiia bacterium]
MAAIGWLQEKKQIVESIVQDEDRVRVNDFFRGSVLANDKTPELLGRLKDDLNKLCDRSLELSAIVDKVQHLYDEISKTFQEKELTQRNYGLASYVASGFKTLGQFGVGAALGSFTPFLPAALNITILSNPVFFCAAVTTSVVASATAITCNPIKEKLEQVTKDDLNEIVAEIPNNEINNNMLKIQDKKLRSSTFKSTQWVEVKKRLLNTHTDAKDQIESLGKGLYEVTEDFNKVLEFANNLFNSLKQQEIKLKDLKLEELNNKSTTATVVATNLLQPEVYSDLIRVSSATDKKNPVSNITSV